MAIAISEPTPEIANNANQDTYATASFTPTANSLLLFFVWCTGDPEIPVGVTGGSLAWQNCFLSVGLAVGAIYWAQVGGAPGAMTVTFDGTGGTPSGCMLACYEVTGHNANNPINQAATATGSSGAAPVLVFPANLKTANGYCAIAVNSTSTTSQSGITASPASWTNIADIAFTLPTTGMRADYRAGGETTDTITWGDASESAWRAFGVEVNEAANGNEHPYAPEPARGPLLAQ